MKCHLCLRERVWARGPSGSMLFSGVATTLSVRFHVLREEGIFVDRSGFEILFDAGFALARALGVDTLSSSQTRDHALRTVRDRPARI